MLSHLEFVKECVINQKSQKKKNIVMKEVYLRCDLTRKDSAKRKIVSI